MVFVPIVRVFPLVDIDVPDGTETDDLLTEPPVPALIVTVYVLTEYLAYRMMWFSLIVPEVLPLASCHCTNVYPVMVLAVTELPSEKFSVLPEDDQVELRTIFFEP